MCGRSDRVTEWMARRVGECHSNPRPSCWPRRKHLLAWTRWLETDRDWRICRDCLRRQSLPLVARDGIWRNFSASQEWQAMYPRSVAESLHRDTSPTPQTSANHFAHQIDQTPQRGAPTLVERIAAIESYMVVEGPSRSEQRAGRNGDALPISAPSKWHRRQAARQANPQQIATVRLAHERASRRMLTDVFDRLPNLDAALLSQPPQMMLVTSALQKFAYRLLNDQRLANAHCALQGNDFPVTLPAGDPADTQSWRKRFGQRAAKEHIASTIV